MSLTANIPPVVLGLRVKRAPTLWLPLLLLWPLLLLALWLLFVAALLFARGAQSRPARRRLHSKPVAHAVRRARHPLDLIRAGMRLAALLPNVAYEPVNRALKENGVDLDVSKIKPENLEDLVAHLQELHVDVSSDGEQVRVFCE